VWLVQITSQFVDQVIPCDFISASQLSKSFAYIEVCIPHQSSLQLIFSFGRLQNMLPSLSVKLSGHVIEALIVAELAFEILWSLS